MVFPAITTRTSTSIVTMVRNRLLFSSLMWAFCLGGVNSHNEDVQSSTIRAKFSGTNAETKKAQIRRSLMDYMMPGNRVAEMDRADAICGAHYSLTTGTALEKTDVSYYYAIESSTLINGTEMTGISVIHMLEQQLYESISGMFLWCYYEEYPSGVVPSTGEGDMGRNLNAPRTSSGHSNKQGDHRRLTLEEARRLGIVTFSSTPFDQQRLDSKFGLELPVAMKNGGPMLSFCINREIGCTSVSSVSFFFYSSLQFSSLWRVLYRPSRHDYE